MAKAGKESPGGARSGAVQRGCYNIQLGKQLPEAPPNEVALDQPPGQTPAQNGCTPWCRSPSASAGDAFGNAEARRFGPAPRHPEQQVNTPAQVAGFRAVLLSCAHCGDRNDRLVVKTSTSWQIQSWWDRHADCVQRANDQRVLTANGLRL